jgi:hypothetical protein
MSDKFTETVDPSGIVDITIEIAGIRTLRFRYNPGRKGMAYLSLKEGIDGKSIYTMVSEESLTKLDEEIHKALGTKSSDAQTEKIQETGPTIKLDFGDLK